MSKLRIQRPIKVYLETYGCTANRFDSEVVLTILSENGFEIVEKPEDSDIILINTCIVKGATQRKMEKRLKELKRYNKPIMVLGCFAQYMPEKLKEYSLVGPYAYDRIVEAIQKTLDGHRVVFLDRSIDLGTKLDSHTVLLDPAIGIVQVSEGCVGSCSYCAVKLARGKLGIVEKEKLVEHALFLIEKKKVKELYLSSQDTGLCGFGLYNIADVIKEILNKTDKEFRIRIGMINPFWFYKIKDSLIELFDDHRLYRFLHLPVQSGSDKVLRDMRRPYTTALFKDSVAYLREFDRYFNIATDIIVGFPTETLEDLEKTRDLLLETKPDIVFLSRFEARPKTEATKYKQIPGFETKRRSRIIARVAEEIALERNKMFLDKEQEIFVIRPKKGKNVYYKVVYLDKDYKPGSIIKKRIKSCDQNKLFV